MNLLQIKQRFGIIGNTPLLNRALEVAMQVAPTDISVLVTGESGTGKEIIPQAIGKQKILSYQYEGYWTDIGNIDSFFEANLGLTDDIPKFNLFDNSSKIYTRARVLPPSKITGSSTIDKSIVTEGCIINGAHIEHSVIGIRNRIGVGSTISNSYLMGNDFYQNLEEIRTNVQNNITKSV